MIRNFSLDKEEIEHFCSTDTGSSGSPIINFETRKVIGIHFGSKLNINVGRLLRKPIEEFFKINIDKKKNEIILNLEIEKDDLNKEIYFLDNINYSDDLVSKKIPEKSLTELNELNMKVYINNNKCNYCRFFKPEKEGNYTIKLELNIEMRDCSQMFHGCYLL